jgi:hypothetical protein
MSRMARKSRKLTKTQRARLKTAMRPTKAQLERLKAAMEPMRSFFEEHGRIGGRVGRDARWKHVSREERSETARKAAQARWAKAHKKK